MSNDDYKIMQNKLLNQSLIVNPHDGDTFLLDNKTTIPLRSTEIVSWYVNEEFVGQGLEILFKPTKPGNYVIHGINKSQKEEYLTISINKNSDQD